MPITDEGLGSHLVGDKNKISNKYFWITKILGEGAS